MKGDFSRNTFNKNKHFSSVRMQQGRVQLDADWNEQMDIWDHRIQTETVDFIGGSGTPRGDHNGYSITTEMKTDLSISKGRYYVNGLLVENPKLESYELQTAYPKATLPTTDGLYVAYLDVWRQGISAVEDNTIEEPALNGADTTTRIKNIGQVKLLAVDKTGVDKLTCVNLFDTKSTLASVKKNVAAWNNLLTPTLPGKLTAKVGANANLTNQLYRVEIHQGGTEKTATFKWSRNNGAVAASITNINGNIITINSLNNDALNFEAAQWLEVNNNERVLQGKSGIFVQLLKVQGNNLTVIGWPTLLDGVTKTQSALASEFSTKSTIRRWDTNVSVLASKSGFINIDKSKTIRNTTKKIVITLASGAILPNELVKGKFIELTGTANSNKISYYVVVESIDVAKKTITVSDLSNVTDLTVFNSFRIVNPGVGVVTSSQQNSFVTLENGLEIQFATGNYKTGDYWLIPTRAVTNKIEDSQLLTPQLPVGIQHHYARLALVEKKTSTWTLVEDCRNLFSALGNGAYQSDPVAPKGSVLVDKTGYVTVDKGIKINGNTALSSAIWQQQAKLKANDKDASDHFGQAVSISGNYAIVGAQNEDTGAENTGAAYIFYWNGTAWQQQAKLQMPTTIRGKNDRFGSAVSISGDRAIVGAYADDEAGIGNNVGSAYVFHRVGTTWTQQPKLQASDRAVDDQFGISVSINGNRAVVGEYGEDTGGTDAGAAYVFQWNGTAWIRQAKLQAGDKSTKDWFGHSVAIDGDRVIVGAHLQDTGGDDAGAAYVFHWNGTAWVQEAKLQASDKEKEDWFGYAVSISGDRAIVGARMEDTGGKDAGAAYIFHRVGTTWTQQAKLQASDKQAGDVFGLHVSISGDRAIVGVRMEDTDGDDAGAAYVFQWNGTNWVQQQKLLAGNKGTGAGDGFGITVGIDGSRAIVGAWKEDTGAADAGAAYVWTLPSAAQTTALQANGSVKVTKDLTVTGKTQTGSLQVDGTAELKKGVTVTGETKTTSMTATGKTQTGSLQVDGTAELKKGVTVTGETKTTSITAQSVSVTANTTNAIFATSTLYNGVYAESTNNTSGSINNNGVYGIAISSKGAGVYGYSEKGSYGVRGFSALNYGVYGESGAEHGVYGKTQSATKAGVNGTSINGKGVVGVSTNNDAIEGLSTNRIGVRGASQSNIGVEGTSSTKIGVYGISGSISSTALETSSGVYGHSSLGAGVRGSGVSYAFYAEQGNYGGKSGVKYLSFTGAHEAIIKNSVLKNLKKGMLLSVTGKVETHSLENGKKELASTLPTVNLCSVANDTKIIGVFSGVETPMKDYWYKLKTTEKLISFNALGDGLAWVSNINGDIKAGDYITASQLPGYGMKQDDGLLHNYTLGKAMEDVDWSKVSETIQLKGKSYKIYLMAIIYTSG